MESVGNLARVPPARRVAGPGASWLMAPFTHASPDRPNRFSAGQFGVLYAGESFETALFETIHHHGLFMAATAQKPGWTSQFREIRLDVTARLHDLRGGDPALDPALAVDDYGFSQSLGARLEAAGSQGVLYPSVRRPGGECVGLFYPDLAANAVQGRHLDYHWNGSRVDFYRDLAAGEVYRIL